MAGFSAGFRSDEKSPRLFSSVSVVGVRVVLTFDPFNMTVAVAYPFTALGYLLGKTSYSDATKAKLVKAYQSEEVRKYVQAEFKGAVLPGF